MAWADVGRVRFFLAAVAAALCVLVSAPHLHAQSPSPGLLFAAGSGNLQTDAFTTSGGKVTVCWTVSGQSPSGAFGPSVAFFLKPTSPGPWGPEFDIEQTTQACSSTTLAAGTYVVNVAATPWTEWSLTITPA